MNSGTDGKNDDSLNDPKGDALSDREVALYGSIIIGLGRVYDVLLMMYAESNPSGAASLRRMHEEGRMWYPPPSYTPDDDDEGDREE